MKEFLYSILDSRAKELIEARHLFQKNKYGVYDTPSLRQLVSLRHLLIRKGIVKEPDPELLLGFSKIECSEILKKLNE